VVVLTVFFPAVPETETAEALPARSETVTLDLTGYHVDGKINIKGDSLGNGGWQTYSYLGKSL
jgi:hypothetical protein